MFLGVKTLFVAMFALSAPGCVTDEEPQPALVAPVEVAPAPKPPKSATSLLPDAGEILAEPIAPSIAKKYPHLRNYQGHILLGTADIQLVLAGATPIVDTSALWQPVILAAFERRPGGWQIKSSLGRVDLAPVAGLMMSSPAVYHAAGVDMGADKATGVAHAAIVLTAEAQPKQLVQVRLDGERRSVTLTIDDFSSPGRTSDRTWQLRLRSDTVTNLVGQETQLGSVSGSPYVVRYDGADVAALMSFRLAQVHDDFGELVVQPESMRPGQSGNPPIEGYELALSRGAVANLHARVQAISDCLYGVKRPKKMLSDAARATWLATCRSDVPEHRAKITLPATDAGGSSAPQPVYLFDDNGAALTYNALFAGESLDLALPAGVRLQFADTRSGRILPGSEPIDLTPAAATLQDDSKPIAVVLPPRRAHSLRIMPFNGDDRAAFVSVSRLDMPRGHALAVDFENDESATRLSDGLFLVKDWPLKLELLDGGYQIDVTRGDDGTICTLRLTVGEGRAEKVSCPKATFTTEIPGLRDQATLDIATVAPPDAGQVEVIRHAFGVDAMVAPVTVAVPTAASPQMLPVLRLDDEQSGLTMQLTPADTELAERWAAEPQGEGQERLERFVKFARREAPDSWLELGCPVAMPPAEYRYLVGRLDPDAVRLIGCWQGDDLETQMLGAAAEGRVGPPLQFTTVSVLHDLTFAGFFPRLLVSKAASASAAELAAALKRGEFSVTAGAAVTDVQLEKSNAAGSTHVVSFNFAATRESRPRYVVLYTEDGRLKRETVSEGGGDAPVKVQVNLTPPKGARYLRIEIKGSPRRTTMSRMFDLDEGVIMAATNFIALSSAQDKKAGVTP